MNHLHNDPFHLLKLQRMSTVHWSHIVIHLLILSGHMVICDIVYLNIYFRTLFTYRFCYLCNSKHKPVSAQFKAMIFYLFHSHFLSHSLPFFAYVFKQTIFFLIILEIEKETQFLLCCH